ncbi:nucleoside hydrolase [Planotetraspora kaengkrachanensis]|uniref:Ribosylpyrimidine nucleosidase n=1 Tax=Planotetraspora kaengkrachanensis TaxID=575193 RepID=A0A8J3M2T8_9ACTN|nr:nucleoside hydrolase [Planotetraspora kaengkrachanensis]GIG78055.1 ribosylpyrimidine nucleosidase [Planotetraspora kaengkrachanensis]
MKRILIDCDPGIDDALAITLAHGSSQVEIIGITTVGGNVSLAKTTENALRLREFLGFPEVPVVPGSAGALLRPRIDAAEVHGDSGLGQVRLPAPTLPPADGHAVDFIIDTLASAPGEISLVAIGPLTNVALAVRKEPRIVDWAREFVILGGSYTRGNYSPAAEFNIVADPEAAAIVFAAGWTVTMIGLDVSRTALATTAVVDRMRQMGRLGADLLVPCAEFYGMVTADDGPAIHDACAIAYLIDPTLIEIQQAVVEVETAGRFTSGMTVVDFHLRDRAPNALVGTAIDTRRFWDLMLGAYERIAATMA